MKRELKERKDETLSEWRERIAPLCTGMTTEQLQEVLREVSVTSYAVGSDAALEVMKKYPILPRGQVHGRQVCHVPVPLAASKPKTGKRTLNKKRV